MRYLHRFEYHTPQTLQEVSLLLQEHCEEARVLAGGTDLLVKMKAGLSAPHHLISLKSLDVPGLRSINVEQNGDLRLGALVTLQSIYDSHVVRKCAVLLVETARKMASHQVRNLATVGGNLCNSSPAADMAPPLIALGARVKVKSSRKERMIALEDFFRGPGENTLEVDEILTDIYVPPVVAAARSTYEKFSLREAMAIATVGVAVSLTMEDGMCKEARIVLGAVGPKAFRSAGAEDVLAGKIIRDALVGEAAKAASNDARPITDVRGSASYRSDLVETLTRRAIQKLL